MREIWFDSDIYELADRGLADGKKAVLQVFAEHVEWGLPIPGDLLAAAARLIRKAMPKIKNDKGIRENAFSAWQNAVCELADRGLAYRKKFVLETFVKHVERSLPIPEDLLAAAARLIRKAMPKIKNDKGVHENDFSAWQNADLVKEMLDADPRLTVEKACYAVSLKIGLSFDAVNKHWKKFRSNDEFKRGEVPPFKMLGTIPFKGASRK